jgi:Ni,Fe-hydrogenase I small subunit
VWVDGSTRKTDGGGSVACAAGPGGAGCIGVGWWEKESGYVASVWDMHNATEIGQVSADVTGTSVLIGAVAPIPIITPVRRKACDRLSQQLRSFLAGDDMGVAVPAADAGIAAGAGAGGSGGAP